MSGRQGAGQRDVVKTTLVEHINMAGQEREPVLQGHVVGDILIIKKKKTLHRRPLRPVQQQQSRSSSFLPFFISGHRVEGRLPLRLVQLGSPLDGRPATPRGGALPQPAG